MKVYVNNGKYFMDDNGTVTELVPNKDNYLALPTNSCNRKWVSTAKVDKKGTIDFGDEVKTPRVLGPRTEKTVDTDLGKFHIIAYLNDEDRAAYDALIAKAKNAYRIAKLEAEIAELQAKKAALQGGND